MACELLILCLVVFKEVKLRYVMNKDEQRKYCHVDATAGHMGIKKTVSKLAENFMRPGVIKRC